jgi:zinc/manganese transport system substrate-binding protein
MPHMNFKKGCFFLLLAFWVRPLQAELSVFACEPEWAALASQLGGDKLEIFTATSALQDPHHVEARPSLIVQMRSADLLLCTGAELEIGWLPVLLRQSANARVQPGQTGHLMAAEEVSRLDVRESARRDEGDVHAAGNPHVHLDPRRLLTIAEKLKERLEILDPSNAGYYLRRYDEFAGKWRLAMADWEKRASPLAGKSVVVHHGNWRYLFEWLKVDVTGDIEPKPGLPPSTTHLAQLLAQAAQQKPAMIVVARYQNPQGAQWLGERAAVPVVILPFTVGGSDSATDLFTLYDSTVNQLVAALTP